MFAISVIAVIFLKPTVLVNSNTDEYFDVKILHAVL